MCGSGYMEKYNRVGGSVLFFFLFFKLFHLENSIQAHCKCADQVLNWV